MSCLSAKQYIAPFSIQGWLLLINITFIIVVINDLCVFCIYRHVLQALKEKPRCRTVAITGTTGMASLNYPGGTTLHHWLGLADGRYDSEVLATTISSEDSHLEVRTRIRKCQVLIIDEIGMLSRHLFDQSEYVCRQVRQNPAVFGGLQVIAAGDVRQLPPVPNRHYGDNGEHCFLSAQFQKVFPHRYHLTKVNVL